MLKQLYIILHIPDEIRIPDKIRGSDKIPDRIRGSDKIRGSDNDVIMGLALLSYTVLRRQQPMTS
jgi:hypothetical protein